MYNEKLTDHFTWKEATVSETAAARGVRNEPHIEDLPAIRHTAEQMEVVRKILGGNPISVNSWYRNEVVNRMVGGVANSAHRQGYAVDFTCRGFGSVSEICKALATSGLQYDQVIWEYGRWVHISFSPRMRQQNLWIRSRSDGYQLGVHP